MAILPSTKTVFKTYLSNIMSKSQHISNMAAILHQISLIHMNRLTVQNLPIIADFFDAFKDRIVDYFANKLETGNDKNENVLCILMNLRDLVGIGVDVDSTNLATILNNHKKDILIKCLKLFKVRNEWSSILAFVDALNKVGVTWPELDTVRKSINAEVKTKINENINDNEYDKLLDRITDKIFYSTMDSAIAFLSLGLSAARKAYPNLQKDVGKLLNADHKRILQRLNDITNTTFLFMYSDVLDWCVELVKIGFDIKYITDFLDKYKGKFIKLILLDIKDGHYFYANKGIKHLDQLKIKWPELKVIKKSIELIIDHEINIDNQQQLDENGAEENKTNFRQLNDIHNLKHSLENYINNARRVTDQSLNNSKFFSDVLYKQLRQAVRLVIKLRYNIDGYNDPELIDILNKRKSFLIKCMFNMISDQEDNSLIILVQSFVNDLMRIGIDWKELPIIKKSVDHDVNKYRHLSEARRQPPPTEDELKYLQSDNIVELINDCLKRGQIYMIITYLQRLQDDYYPGDRDDLYTAATNTLNQNSDKFLNEVNELISAGDYFKPIILVTTLKDFDVNFTWLNSWLDNNKKLIITGILKDVAKSDYLQPTFAIDDLRALDKNWPELGIISKSLKAEKPGLIESYTDNMSDNDVIELFNYYLNSSSLFSITSYIMNILDGIQKDPKLLKYLANLIDENSKKIKQLFNKELSVNYSPIIIYCRWLIEFGAGPGWIIDWLNEHKNQILKSTLVTIKNGDIDAVSEKVFDLNDIGIKWPELDVIKKSIDADRKKLTETKNYKTNNKIFDHLKNLLVIQGHDYVVLNDIIRITGTKFRTDTQLFKDIIAFLDNHSEDIQRLFDSILDKGLYASVFYYCIRLRKNGVGTNWITGWVEDHKHNISNAMFGDIRRYDIMYVMSGVSRLIELGINTDWILNLINENKSDIMKEILTYVKNNRIGEVSEIIDTLKQANINWPELDVIKKSIYADRITPLNENTPQSNYTLASNNELAQLNKYLNNNDLFRAITYIKDIDQPKLFNDIINLVNEHINDIQQELVTKLKNGAYQSVFYYCQQLIKFGAEVDWIPTMINDNKHAIIIAMLISIRDSYIASVSTGIKFLREMNIKWPEIDIITKSINNKSSLDEMYYTHATAEHNAIRTLIYYLDNLEIFNVISYLNSISFSSNRRVNAEIFKKVGNLLDDYSKNIQQFLDNDITKGVYSVAVLCCVRFKEFGINSNWLIDWVNNHKHDILRILLTFIKNSDLLMAVEMVDDLTYIGVKWSELDVIKASLAADKKELNEAINGFNFTYATDDQIFDQLNDHLRSNSLYKVKKFMNGIKDNIKKYRPALYEDLISLINDYSREIQQELVTKLKNGAYLEVLNYCYLFISYGADRTWILDWIENNKSGILKLILADIRESNWSTSMSGVAFLDDILVTPWPELSIIKKSFESERINLNEWISVINYRSASDNAMIEQLNDYVKNGELVKIVNFIGYIQYHTQRNRPNLYKTLINILNDHSKEIQYEFDSDLRCNLYDTIIYSCMRLIEAGVDQTWILNWINSNKRNIISMILSDIKNLKMHHVKTGLAWLKILNIKWPELGTITKSLNADKTKLEETIDLSDLYEMSDGEIIYQLNEYFNPLNLYNIMSYIRDVRKYIIQRRPHLLKKLITILNNHSKEIQVALNNRISYGSIRIASSYCDRLLDFGVGPDWIIKWIENHKNDFIKLMLIDIKNGDIGSTIGTLTYLKQIPAIKWPELDIMQNSINHDQFQLSENIKYDPKEKIVNVLDRFLHDDSSLYHLINFLHTTENYVKKYKPSVYKDMITLINDNHTLIERKLEDRLLTDNVYSSITVWCYALIKFGADQNWIIKWLNTNKDNIIKSMLTDIKNNNRYCYILASINDLNKCGIHWPELDIIDKSLSHDFQNNLNENSNSNSELHELMVYRNFENDLRRDSILPAIKFLVDNQYKITQKLYIKLIKLINDYHKVVERNFKNWLTPGTLDSIFAYSETLIDVGVGPEWITSWLNNNKGEILKLILIEIANYNSASEFNYMLGQISVIKHCDINWPELDIIDKSLNHEYLKYIQ